MNSRYRRLNEWKEGQEKINMQSRELKRTMAEAADAAMEGTATLDQYAIIGGSLVKQSLKRWGPTLTVGRARRQLDLREGYRTEKAWLAHLPGDVLSHHPSEQLSDDLRTRLVETDELLNGKSSDPDDRAAAAIARLIIGAGLGESRRSYFWSGRCEKLASKKNCIYEKWWNNGLLDVWTELDVILANLYRNAGAEPIPDDCHHVVPYSVVEHLLWDHYGGVGRNA